MTPRQSKLIAAGALILGGFLTFRALQTSPATPDASAAGTGSAMPGKSGGERIDPARSLGRLRSLREIRASDAPDFETVESWSRSLSDSGLLELIEENRNDPYEGLTGWLRCALFAEWGRRDPQAAIAFLDANTMKFDSGYKEAQTAFSIFRGWASVDPDASLAKFRGLIGAMYLQVDVTPRKVLVAIFNELASRDPRNALRIATELGNPRLGTAYRFPLPFPGSTSSDPTGLHNPHVMTGLFKGLRSKEDLESTMDTWTAQVWKSAGTTKALGAHLAHVASGSSQSRARPPELEVALQAAISLAAHDFNAAESWLQGLTFGSDDLDNQQRDRFHLLWALARPAEAFAYLKAGTHPEQQQQYATAVLCRLPSRGPELMAALDSAEIRYKAIQVAASDLGIYSTHDYYPAPGQANRLPDFEANYAAILATLAAAKLPPIREADLLKRIHWDFQSRVPAADAAARR